MKLRIRSNQMEEVEGLYNEYPYVFHHVDLSRTPIPWHWHEAVEFCYVLSGSVKVSTAGQSRVFQKGEGLFLNSNVLMSMTEGDDCILDSHLFHPVFLSGHFKSVFETKYLNPVIQNRSLDMLPIPGKPLSSGSCCRSSGSCPGSRKIRMLSCRPGIWSARSGCCFWRS